MKTDFSTEAVGEWRVVAPVLNALGSTTRQRIVMLFDPGEHLNIKTIAEQFDLSRTAVVHHINVLQEAGIIKGERVGKELLLYVDWRLVAATMDRVKAYIKTRDMF